MPRTAANYAGTHYSLPSLAAYEGGISRDIDSKLLRNPDKDTLIIRFRDSLLRKYHVADVSKLPLNFEGAYAQIYEDFGNHIHDEHADTLFHKIISQNRFTAYFSYINPYQAIRQISMGITATDFLTYTDFQQKAEAYRRYLVREMNADYRDHSHYGEFYEYKAGRRLWESIKDFKYTIPAVATSFSQLLIECAALIVWVILSIVAVKLLTRKLIL
jgi:ABC-2 type transport system permease protein